MILVGFMNAFQVQFQVDDISGDDFKLEDDWFDLVFCHHVICSIEDKCKLLTKLLVGITS